jgi:long-chain acyl-CoA synthetase
MLQQAIHRHAANLPEAIALEDAQGALSYAALLAELHRLVPELRQRLQGESGGGLRGGLAVALPNGIPAALLDLAALEAGIPLLPLPPFFSEQQIRHCLLQAGAGVLIATPEWLRQGVGAELGTSAEAFPLAGQSLALVRLPFGDPQRLPPGIAKVTFTSGTTGAPKGVLLTAGQMLRVAESLLQVVPFRPGDRHLCVSPLPILLENIGGLYTPLLAGLTSVLPAMQAVGLRGAAGLDAARLAGALTEYRAASAILSPVMLQGLVEQGARLPGLRFLAVGGAAVPPALLEGAAALGLPVYQGYGLSECASVVTLNGPDANRPGSVGRALPQNQVRLAADGEVLVRGNLFAGYLGEAAPRLEDGWWRSGDLGRLDAEGYLWLHGRRNHLIITTFGRNLDPEWVEGELCLRPAIAQAALFGDGRPWNCALISPAAGADPTELELAVREVNARLPDYARVTAWLPTDQPFSLFNGQLTGTGRLRRQAIQQAYGPRIAQLYEDRSS